MASVDVVLTIGGVEVFSGELEESDDSIEVGVLIGRLADAVVARGLPEYAGPPEEMGRACARLIHAAMTTWGDAHPEARAAFLVRCCADDEMPPLVDMDPPLVAAEESGDESDEEEWHAAESDTADDEEAPAEAPPRARRSKRGVPAGPRETRASSKRRA